jgi:predicted acetyltransferase
VPVVIRPFTPEDTEAVHVLAMRAFSARPGTPPDPDRPRVPDERRLVAELDGRVVGHVGAWELGQWFGGRRVAVAGISAVTIAPEVRGQRVGSTLLRAGLDAARERGEPLATLFPLTRRIYRSHGFELAGEHPAATVTAAALGRIPPPEGDLRVVPGGADDLHEMAALERALAAAEPGALDRPEAFAARNLVPGEHDRVVLVRRGDELTGYVVYGHEEPEPDVPTFFRLQVKELVGADADTLRALYRVLGSHASGASTVSLPVAPHDPLELWLPEQAWRPPRVAWRWMTRLLDPAAAIAARGWPAHLSLRCELDLVDPLWPEHSGTWTLEVRDGRGSLTRGGAGTVRTDVGALASWFTGYQSASRLARHGRVAGGDAATLAALDAATLGPTPSVRAFF